MLPLGKLMFRNTEKHENKLCIFQWNSLFFKLLGFFLLWHWVNFHMVKLKNTFLFTKSKWQRGHLYTTWTDGGGGGGGGGVKKWWRLSTQFRPQMGWVVFSRFRNLNLNISKKKYKFKNRFLVIWKWISN